MKCLKLKPLIVHRHILLRHTDSSAPDDPCPPRNSFVTYQRDLCPLLRSKQLNMAFPLRISFGASRNSFQVDLIHGGLCERQLRASDVIVGL